MRNLLLITLVFVVLLNPAIPAGREVIGLDVFNTSGFDCSQPKQMRGATWVNNIGDIRIYNALVWVGASGGTVADIGTIVYRVSDDSILFHQNWDHYSEPSGIHTDRLNLSPNYMVLRQGDALSLAYWCEVFDDARRQANVIITIWYSK